MIELNNDNLTIHCSEVPEQAKLLIHCQRTLRIPDDGREYPLPAGLGRFPLRHVDDYARTVPRPTSIIERDFRRPSARSGAG
jgi:hypothetical protein